MASRQVPANPKHETGSAQDMQAAAGLDDMLAGLLGTGGGGPDAVLRALIEQIGGEGEGGLDDILAKLLPQARGQADQEAEPPEGGLEDILARLLPQARGQAEPEEGPLQGALQAVAGAQAAGGTAAVPDALMRALQALGLPPAMLEKLLPAILARLPSLAQAEKKAAPGRRVRKSTPEDKPTTAKPAKRATTPSKSASKEKRGSSAGTSSGKAGGTGSKSSRSTGAQDRSSRSTSKSSGTGTRRKRTGETAAVDLDDLLKNLEP